MKQDAQNWLDNTIPANQRAGIQRLSICSVDRISDRFHQYVVDLTPEQNRYYFDDDTLTGKLNLREFINLEEIDIHDQEITDLDLRSCSKLREIRVDFNKLEWISFPTNGHNLESIHVSDNNLSARDLSCFAKFRNLKELYLGTEDKEEVVKNIYNRWNGSLIHLEKLNRLEKLEIDATDIDSGLEHLPTLFLTTFTFSNRGRDNAGVDALKRALNFSDKQAREDGEKYDNVDDITWKMTFIQNWQKQQRQQTAQIQVNPNIRKI